MSTGLIWRTNSTSSEKTEQLAERLGSKLQGGETIELVSDLGGGKTTFVRGLARGMGSSSKVSSPSFTLSNAYETGKLTLFHFDFYRLSEPGIMKEELAECIADPQAVTVVEWADIVEDVLPVERVTIRLTATGENDREITIECPENLKYILESVS
jgi:tRNA threonylcarbamoyladenosine biosynthesis protein TsaE